jgi:hypothetical protein
MKTLSLLDLGRYRDMSVKKKPREEVSQLWSEVDNLEWLQALIRLVWRYFMVYWLIAWCLTSTLTVFQLYRGMLLYGNWFLLRQQTKHYEYNCVLIKKLYKVVSIWYSFSQRKYFFKWYTQLSFVTYSGIIICDHFMKE